MKIHTQVHTLETGGGIEMINLDDRLSRTLADSGVSNGMVIISSRHTTTALTINEYEERLLQDVYAFCSRLVTNWPTGARRTVCMSEARAMENHVYYAAVNRVGEVVGIATWGHTEADRIKFLVPINAARSLLAESVESPSGASAQRGPPTPFRKPSVLDSKPCNSILLSAQTRQPFIYGKKLVSGLSVQFPMLLTTKI